MSTPNSPLSNRAARIKPSATLEIDALAKKLISEGEDVISFAAGEPDFNPPNIAIKSAINSLESDKSIHKYSNVAGLNSLRELVINSINSRLTSDAIRDNKYSIDNCIITNGGKEAVFLTFGTLINQGDEVLLPTPAWLTYDEVIRFFDGVPVNILGEYSNGFKVNVDLLEKHYTNKTKVLLLNSPNNPTGSVYTEDELKQIANWAINKGIIIISDEIYENLFYGDLWQKRSAAKKNYAPNLLEISPELKEQLVIINGVAKSHAMTGWRVGWVIASDVISSAIKRLKGHLSSNTNNLAQVMAYNALNDTNDSLSQMRECFERRSQITINLLNQIKTPSGNVLKINNPEGAFYAFCDITEMLNTPIGKSGRIAKSAVELAKILLEEIKVAVIPMESFGIENHIRLSYALSEKQITEGIGRMIKFFANEL